MRIIALEEHVSFSRMNAFLPENLVNSADQGEAVAQMLSKLDDVTGERLSSMKESGVSMQVLSVENTDVNRLPDPLAVDFAMRYNDMLMAEMKNHQESFTAFALLPMNNPAAAAEELERTVREYGFRGAMIKGTVNGEFLDAPKFAPVFERAEKLGVPIYIHPGLPPKEILYKYYSNIGEVTGVNEALACYGWGWHSETAIHILRLFVAGIFDKYPKLKIIIGHMGEMLPMMWNRMNGVFHPGNAGKNQRTLIDTFRDQLFITTSGIFTQPPLQLAIETIGIDNILFSVDYPFSSNQMGINFLNNIQLPDDQIAKIAYKNADKLLKLSDK